MREVKGLAQGHTTSQSQSGGPAHNSRCALHTKGIGWKELQHATAGREAGAGFITAPQSALQPPGGAGVPRLIVAWKHLDDTNSNFVYSAAILRAHSTCSVNVRYINKRERGAEVGVYPPRWRSPRQGFGNSRGEPAEKNEVVAGFPHTLPSRFLLPPPLDRAL